jgi:hypothetical protein
VLRLVLLPTAFGLVFVLLFDLIPLFDKILTTFTTPFDFPIPVIEAFLSSRLVSFISRVCLNVFPSPGRGHRLIPVRTNRDQLLALSLFSVGAATPCLLFLISGPEFENMTVMHAAGLVISLVLMLVVNTRITIDFCLIVLQTSLSVVPILSDTSGVVTSWVRNHKDAPFPERKCREGFRRDPRLMPLPLPRRIPDARTEDPRLTGDPHPGRIFAHPRQGRGLLPRRDHPEDAQRAMNTFVNYFTKTTLSAFKVFAETSQRHRAVREGMAQKM